MITPRYSVCEPAKDGGYPTEVLATGDRANAFAHVTGDQVVYDWSIPGIITEAGR